jgi:hypothetical protein
MSILQLPFPLAMKEYPGVSLRGERRSYSAGVTFLEVPLKFNVECLNITLNFKL